MLCCVVLYRLLFCDSLVLGSPSAIADDSVCIPALPVPSLHCQRCAACLAVPSLLSLLALFCLGSSCLVLSNPGLVLFCLLSCPVLSVVLSCLLSSFFALSCFILSLSLPLILSLV